jgi:hypothetical protein
MHSRTLQFCPSTHLCVFCSNSHSSHEELSVVLKPKEISDSTKPTEYLVSHGQAQQEQCYTICNFNAISSSIGKQTFFCFFHMLSVIKLDCMCMCILSCKWEQLKEVYQILFSCFSRFNIMPSHTVVFFSE